MRGGGGWNGRGAGRDPARTTVLDGTRARPVQPCSSWACSYCSAVSSSPSSVTSTVNSQPSPYGSEFTSPGSSTTAALTSTTVPETGAKSSETDLVDSTSPQTSPAVTVEPASGRSR